jgi:hypothetical protein
MHSGIGVAASVFMSRSNPIYNTGRSSVLADVVVPEKCVENDLASAKRSREEVQGNVDAG